MRQSEAEKGQAGGIENETGAARFFMSANTPSGFVSRFDRLYDKDGGFRAYILKGAPGLSPALLPDAGKKFEDKGLKVQYIHCVSDPGGVFAVVVPELKVCITDGMPPHPIVPEFPGVVEEEVGLCSTNIEKLNKQRDRILQFSARAAAQYDRAYRFLSAAESLKSDTYRIALENTDLEGIEKYASGLSRRIFTHKKRKACDTPRFLSGVTADGVISFADTVVSNYARVYIIEDEYGVGSLLLTALRGKAMEMGQDVITCNCPMLSGERPEHLLIPGLSIAFLTSNRFHRIQSKLCRHINIKRFMDYDAMRLKKARVGFNRRAAKELLNQAVELLGEAKADDDIVKSCYAPCIDLSAAKSRMESLVDKILKQ